MNLTPFKKNQSSIFDIIFYYYIIDIRNIQNIVYQESEIQFFNA
jgi:hypothetical protein